jgi:heme/copper-type cytochrome/quinol oxidase subunit 2
MWTWWTNSTAGLWTRIAIGVLIFLALAFWDYRRNRDQATRWREYLVLVACTLAAMAYGIVNDQITSTISWEYFYYGKGLEETLGPQLPPDPVKLHLAAAVVGIQATWSAGLIIGVALLLANNPSKTLPRLPDIALLNQLPIIFLITAATAAIGAILGYTGRLTRFH